MKHIQDYELAGHEVMIYQDGGREGFDYAVDIRKDATEGDIIGAYTGFASQADALFAAKIFIEGYKYGYGHGSTLS